MGARGSFAIPHRSKQILIERPTGRGAILSLFPWDVGVLIDLWTIAIIEGLVVSYVFLWLRLRKGHFFLQNPPRQPSVPDRPPLLTNMNIMERTRTSTILDLLG